MGLINRIWRVMRANINSLVAETPDPEKVLEQAVMDMQEDLIRMRQAVAQAIATQKRAQRKCLQVEATADQWRDRAKIALVQEDEMLARQALARRQPYMETARTLHQQVREQSLVVSKLRQDLQDLEQKISELKAKKDLYIARARSAKTSIEINSIMGKLNSRASSSVWERIEEQVHQSEAMASLSRDMGSGKDLDERFAALSAGSDIDRELALLKSQI